MIKKKKTHASNDSMKEEVTDLGVLSVASFPLWHLVVFIGETNAEYSQEVTISSLNIDIGFNKGLKLRSQHFNTYTEITNDKNKN